MFFHNFSFKIYGILYLWSDRCMHSILHNSKLDLHSIMELIVCDFGFHTNFATSTMLFSGFDGHTFCRLSYTDSQLFLNWEWHENTFTYITLLSQRTPSATCATFPPAIFPNASWQILILLPCSSNNIATFNKRKQLQFTVT